MASAALPSAFHQLTRPTGGNAICVAVPCALTVTTAFSVTGTGFVFVPFEENKSKTMGDTNEPGMPNLPWTADAFTAKYLLPLVCPTPLPTATRSIAIGTDAQTAAGVQELAAALTSVRMKISPETLTSSDCWPLVTGTVSVKDACRKVLTDSALAEATRNNTATNALDLCATNYQTYLPPISGVGLRNFFSLDPKPLDEPEVEPQLRSRTGRICASEVARNCWN